MVDMFPQELSQWSVELLTELLAIGNYETETFDYKENLPHSKNDTEKLRLRKTCCAFANSYGGFIIFGVADDRANRPDERLVGLDPDLDFPEHFGNFPRNCSPTIHWLFRNPPLYLANRRVIHVVHIPKSWSSPHAVGSSNDGWHFTKRTNKGNEGMSMEEIRSGFLGFYEKRLKLQLLKSELTSLRTLAEIAFVSDGEIEKQYRFITFDTNIIESVISDTYTITSNHLDFLHAITVLRQVTCSANNRINAFLAIVFIPVSPKNSFIREHNEALRLMCEMIMELCDKA